MQNTSQTAGDRLSRTSTLDRDWLVVAASAVGLVFSVGTLLVYSFGVFVRPLNEAFGWNRTEVSGAVALSQYTLAAFGWLWGVLIDRYGPRVVLVPSVVIIGVLFASLGLLTSNLMHLYLVFGAIPILAGGAAPIGYSGVLIRKFDRRLGLALGIALMGIGLGASIIPPLTSAILQRAGWREAYVLLGVLTIVVTLPAALVATRGLGRDARRRDAASTPVWPAIRTRRFLQVCVTFLIMGMVSLGAVAHFVPMMQDRSMSLSQAATIAGSIGLGTLVFRAAGGWVLDHVHARVVLSGTAVLAAVALAFLAYGQNTLTAWAAALLLGAVLGAEADLIAYQVSRYFSAALFGRLFGIAFGVYVVGVGTGPLIMGVSHDFFGGYRGALLIFILLSIGVALTAFTMPDYQRANTAE